MAATTQKQLTLAGWDVLIPMFGKGSLRTEMKFKAHNYRGPLTTNHAIFSRDKWMVQQVDILFANFTGATIVSIGSMFELAWGSLLGKQVIVVIDKKNIHQHAFVLEAASIIFEDENEAISYLTKLARKEY